MKYNRPIVAISSGDPAGIGPEITLKALTNEKIHLICRPIVVCDFNVIDHINKHLNFNLIIKKVRNVSEATFQYGTVNVLDVPNIDMSVFEFNKISKMTGNASFEYVVKVIMLALSDEVAATVTGPIHKEAIKMAGHNFQGHTEIYAHYTNTTKYAMMLAEGGFRVVHVSTHVSLLEAISRVKKERILDTINLGYNALIKMGIKDPKIAVAGLNPHAGENGLFGREEIDEIVPAILEANEQGIDAKGPFPPDTIFPIMKGGMYDLVVCMYHDQGHIPTKLIGFDYNHKIKKWEGLSGVNITLGLPIVRVSVDHGVAFDKGGNGEANPESMIQAILMSVKLTGN